MPKRQMRQPPKDGTSGATFSRIVWEEFRESEHRETLDLVEQLASLVFSELPKTAIHPQHLEEYHLEKISAWKPFIRATRLLPDMVRPNPAPYRLLPWLFSLVGTLIQQD